ncbi:MAG: hypothetical protein HYY78_23515 [Betaproteobacteria bacterium]|nr:hypothetical protein [Betaproteobacteria bacterium]
MGVEIKLTDKEFPVSPVFIDFLHRHIEEKGFEASWHDQLSEALVPAQAEERQQAAVAVADRVLQNPAGQKAILRSYELLTALMVGQPDKLRLVHERYRFVCVVGCPRHGGSYLTKQLFVAVGMDPDQVPNAIAHDGFPDAAPFQFKENYNSLTTMIQNMAEYLAMVEVFFANSRVFDNLIVVPKKATKAAYHGAFFHTALGPNTEYVITLRHPLPACISTYEKSTGLPQDGKFKVRGNIEEWARRDAIFTGADPDKLMEQDYFEVYLRYWEQYHYDLALTGLAASRNWSVVVYGGERMMDLAASYFKRFKSRGKPEAFKVFDNRRRHPQWRNSADAAVRRVAGVWTSVGLAFPVEELMECW